MKYITLDEVIAYFDDQTPNHKTREDKIGWIAEIEERIYEEIIKPRLPLQNTTLTITEADVGVTVSALLTIFDYNAMLTDSGTTFSQAQIGTVVSFEVTSEDVGKTFGRLDYTPYDETTSGETVLLCPSMFKDLYRYWIEKNVDISNREIGAANNAMAIFQTYYDDYFAYYNRNHRVKGCRQIYHII